MREIERRIQKVEAFNTSGEVRDLPTAPNGVPDSYEDHVKLMFDLQAAALAADVTRVFAFKLSRDVSNRVYPGTGVTTGFHIASHHADREERILDFAKINAYHVGLMPYLLEKLKNTPDADGSVLDNTVIVYGSPMGNSNVHNHKRCPLLFAGHGGGAIKGNHAPEGAGRHADGQRHALGAADARVRDRQLRRQHGADGSERGARGDERRVAAVARLQDRVAAESPAPPNVNRELT